MPYQDLCRYDCALLANYRDPLADRESVFSTNTKMGKSIDFPIARTCRPTEVCAALCYGSKKSSPQGRDISVLEKQVRVYRYFREVDPATAAHRVVNELGTAYCVRWCGVGDLDVQVIKVINAIAHEYPNVRQWIVTRKPNMAAQIVREAPNLWIMFSLDGSPDSKRRQIEMARHRHPRLYYSFLRQSVDEDTLQARIIFDAKPTGQLSELVCPADAGLLGGKKDACARCGWRCLSAAVLDRASTRGPFPRSGSRGLPEGKDALE